MLFPCSSTPTQLTLCIGDLYVWWHTLCLVRTLQIDYKTFVLHFFVKHVCCECNDILHNASKSSELVFDNWLVNKVSILRVESLPLFKGQIKPKSRFARRRFSRKTNGQIWFVCREEYVKSKQNKFIHLFGGRIYGTPICFRN